MLIERQKTLKRVKVFLSRGQRPSVRRRLRPPTKGRTPSFERSPRYKKELESRGLSRAKQRKHLAQRLPFFVTDCFFPRPRRFVSRTRRGR